MVRSPLQIGTLGDSLPCPAVGWRGGVEAVLKAMILCFPMKQFPILGVVTGTGWPLPSKPYCGEATVFAS